MSGWKRLAAAVKEANEKHGRPGHPIDGYVGISLFGGESHWYGGTAYDGDPMEETAVSSPEIPQFYRYPEASEADFVADLVAQALEAWNAGPGEVEE